MRIQKKYIVIIIIGIVIFLILMRERETKVPLQNNNRISFKNYVLEDDEDFTEETVLTRDEAIYNYWDEIKEYVNGTDVIVACSFESNNCYDVEADISDGYIQTIYFDNGGYLYFDAEIDSDGFASDFDIKGNSWDFEVDMDSDIIEDAIYDWAADNGYTIE